MSGWKIRGQKGLKKGGRVASSEAGQDRVAEGCEDVTEIAAVGGVKFPNELN